MPDQPVPKRVSIHYLKSEQFRECHVDGAVGGQTPKGSVWIGLYSERLPIPLEAVHDLKPVDGAPNDLALGEMNEDATKTKTGIIRTLEVGLHLDLATARALYEWLGEVDAIREVGD